MNSQLNSRLSPNSLTADYQNFEPQNTFNNQQVNMDKKDYQQENQQENHDEINEEEGGGQDQQYQEQDYNEYQYNDDRNDVQGVDQSSNEMRGQELKVSTPYRLSQNKRINKVQNLESYLANSYEKLKQSSSKKNLYNSNYIVNNSNKKKNRNIQLVTSQLQKVLNPQEILDLAQCLTSKSAGNLSCNNRSRNSSANKNNNPFFQSNSFGKIQSDKSLNQERGRSSSSNEYTYAFVRNSQKFSSSAGLNQSRNSINSQTRSLSANNAQLRLYKYSEIQKKRSNLIKMLVNKQAKEEASKRKISKSSNQILTDLMDKSINDALHQVDHMIKKQVTFEQIGRVLYLLKVFRCLSYDENFRIIPQLVVEKQMDTKRKFSEMFFHEELWKACSVNVEEVDEVSNSVVYCMLRILMDPVQLSTSATVNLMKEYLAKFNESYSEYIITDSLFEEQLIKLVEGWKLLQIDRFAYRSIGYLKQRQVDDLCKQQDMIMTFHPKIEKTSELFELHSTANFLQRHPIDGALLEAYEQRQREMEDEYGISSSPYDQRTGSQQGSNHHIQANSVERYKILYKKQEIIEDKLRKMRLEKEIKEMEPCTFHPNLSLNSKINECSVVSHYNGTINIYERLYKPINPIEFYERTQLIEEEKALLELQECTFKPQVNKTRMSGINEKIDAKDLVQDFSKSVGRLSSGFQKAQILKKKLDFISKGEKLNYLKSLPPNPPSLLQRKVTKEQAIKQLQVSLSKNKVLTISLRQSDNPKSFARNFAKIHQISPIMEKKLEEIISQYLSGQEEVSS